MTGVQTCALPIFLGCGSVIVALHHEQDMRRMGGLKDKLLVTYWTFVIGSLALAGFPLTSGFFSKDELLVSAWASGPLGQILTIFGLLTAMMTAFYSFRLVFVTFWGTYRGDAHGHGHGHGGSHEIHEPSKTITVPLLVLSVLSIAAGYFGIFEFLSPALPGPAAHESGGHHGPAGTIIMVVATLLGLTGIAAAYFVYVKSPSLPDRLAQQWQSLYRLSLNKWFVDEFYNKLFVNPTFTLADRLWKHVDVAVIDGAVNGTARAIAWWGWLMRLFQSGQTQHYALGMALGAVVILTAFLLL